MFQRPVLEKNIFYFISHFDEYFYNGPGLKEVTTNLLREIAVIWVDGIKYRLILLQFLV